MTISPSDLATVKRAARLTVLAVLTALVLADAVLLWTLGFKEKPHHLLLAVIVAAVLSVGTIGSQLWLYTTRMRVINKS